VILLPAAAAAAVLCWPARARPSRRVHALGASPTAAAGRRPLPLLAGLSLVLTLAGLPWWVPAAGAVAWGLSRRRRRPRFEPAAVALAAELVGACLSGGALPAAALRAAAAAIDPPLRDLLVETAGGLSRGTDPWARWQSDPALAPMGRILARAGTSGTASAGELTRAAARLRAARAATYQQRLAQASVWVVLPMGLCFLPAFVLVGVVPVVLGLLHAVRL
jgi:hypothetical protein